MEEDDLRNQIEQLEDELQAARDRLLEKETEWDQLQDEMETEIQDLKQQVDDLKDEVQSLTERLDAAEEKARDEETRADSLESETEDLQANVDFLERKLSRLTDDYYNRMEEVQQDMANAVIWWKPPGDVLWYTIYNLLRKGLPRVFQKGLGKVKDEASLLEFDKKLTPLVWKFVAPIIQKKYQELMSQFK